MLSFSEHSRPSVGGGAALQRAAWCPLQDLLAAVTNDATLHLHRLSWERMATARFGDGEPLAKSLRLASAPSSRCAIASLCWQPDGTALALGFHAGIVAVYAIESRSVVAHWAHSRKPVTLMRWLQFGDGAMRAYVDRFAPPARRGQLRRQMGAAFVPRSDATTFFPPLAPLDPNASSASAEPLASVAADGFAPATGGHMLLCADLEGNVRVRALGTMDVLHLSLPAPILSLDLCSASGLLSAVCRTGETVQLRTLFTGALWTHSAEVRFVAAQMQQLTVLSDYVAKAIEQMATKWKAARRSFDNRMMGLSDVLSELASDAHSRGEASSADPTSDPQSELLELLLTGLPSYACQQFLTRYMSSGPWTKVMDNLAALLAELLACIRRCVLPALEQLAYRAEELLAHARWEQRFLCVGLKVEEVSSLQRRAALLHLQSQSLSRALSDAAEQYAQFGAWLLAAIRLANNEHDSLPALPHGASDAERDAQPVPVYGPFDLDAVDRFVQRQLQRDAVGAAIGSVGERSAEAQGKAAAGLEEYEIAQAKQSDADPSQPLLSQFFLSPAPVIPAAPSNAPSDDPSPPSLSQSFLALLHSISSIGTSVCEELSSGCVEQPPVRGVGGAAPMELLRLEPLSSASAAPADSLPQSLPGTGRTVALRSHHATRGAGESNRHMVAFLWRREDQQFVSVVAYHTASSSGDAAAAAPSFPPPQHLTLLVPPLSSPAGAAQAVRVLELQFYGDSQLQLLLQHEEDTPEGASGLSSKVLLLDLEEEAVAAQWRDMEPAELHASSFESTIARQITADPSSCATLQPSTVLSGSELAVLPCRARSFPQTLVGGMALNPARSLSALLLAGRGAAGAPAADEAVQPDDASLQLQLPYKPTRRVILLDMAEDDEEEEDDEGEEDGGGEEEAAEQEPQEDGDDEEMEEEEEQIEEEEEAEADAPMDESDTPSKNTRSRASGGLAGASASSARMLSFLTLLTLVLGLLCSPLPASASIGDWDPRFRSCLSVCQGRCAMLPQAAQQYCDTHKIACSPSADPMDLLPDSAFDQLDLLHIPTAGLVGPRPLSWPLRRLFGWSCEANCAYECMHVNVAQRAARGEPTVKYYGKWPFVRMLGCQEFFSAIFSLLNMIPHMLWLMRWRKEFTGATSSSASSFSALALNGGSSSHSITGSHSALSGSAVSGVTRSWLPLWDLYACVYLNTWLWSAAFHARDVLLTERLDYFCASAGITFSLCIAVVRCAHIRSWRARIGAVFLPLIAGLLIHIGYLQIVHFDYGWNMKVSIGVGVAHSAVWMLHCWRHRADAYNRRMVLVTVLLWAAATCEVFDFPPLFDLLDAHALWHGLTPPIAALFYSWVRDDLRAISRQQQQKAS